MYCAGLEGDVGLALLPCLVPLVSLVIEISVLLPEGYKIELHISISISISIEI